MQDVFAVPQSELTAKQLAKSPLLESEIEWGKLSALDFGKPTKQLQEVLRQVKKHFQTLAGMIPRSPRATANLVNWRRTVNVRTAGGSFSFVVGNSTLKVGEESTKPDLVLAIKDPAILLTWLRDCTEAVGEELKSPALTDMVIEGTLILNKPELETITRLDRVPRSLRRDKVLASAS